MEAAVIDDPLFQSTHRERDLSTFKVETIASLTGSCILLTSFINVQ